MSDSQATAGKTQRIDATPAALALVERLGAKYGPLMFHQTGGCCDGSFPSCYPEDEFFLGQTDVCVGSIAGAPFYMNDAQFEYWKTTHLTIDVAAGRGDAFSLENKDGVRFTYRPRPFTPEEIASLAPARRGCPDSGPAH